MSNKIQKTPQKQQDERSFFAKTLAFLGAVLSGLFLLNFTLGIFEIPDNLPIVGNLDEVVLSGIFYACLSYLGIDVIPFRNRSSQKPKKTNFRENEGA